MFIPYFNMARSHVFMLSKASLLGLLEGSVKEVEYCSNKDIKVGECVTLKEYSNGISDIPPMYIDAYITSVKEKQQSGSHIRSFIFGLNVQLIMF